MTRGFAALFLTLACLLGACNTLAPTGDAVPPEDVIDDSGLGGGDGPSY